MYHRRGYGVAAFVALASVAATLQQAKALQADIADIDEIDRLITWRELFRANSDSLMAAFTADAVISYAALIVLTSSVAMSRGQLYESVAFVIYLVVLIVVMQLSLHGKIKISGWPFYALFICGLPALLNYPIVHMPPVEGFLGAGLRTLVSGFLLLALVIIGAGAICLFEGADIYSWLLNRLPSRRKIMRGALPIANRMAVIEFFFFSELFILGAASIAIGGVLQTFYQLSGMRLVFVIFNLTVAVPSLFSLIFAFSKFDTDTAFLVRRVGMRYAVLTMAIVNLFAGLGYLLGYLVRFGYELGFGSLGRFPIPDQAYAAFAIAPGELPFFAQVEGLLIASIVILALSWVFVVLQKRAWGEAIWVLASMAAVFVLPHFRDELAGLTKLIGAFFPLLKQAPEVVIALSIPAIKSFFSSEVQDGVKQAFDARTSSAG